MVRLWIKARAPVFSRYTTSRACVAAGRIGSISAARRALGASTLSVKRSAMRHTAHVKSQIGTAKRPRLNPRARKSGQLIGAYQAARGEEACQDARAWDHLHDARRRLIKKQQPCLFRRACRFHMVKLFIEQPHNHNEADPHEKTEQEGDSKLLKAHTGRAAASAVSRRRAPAARTAAAHRQSGRRSSPHRPYRHIDSHGERGQIWQPYAQTCAQPGRTPLAVRAENRRHSAPL